MPEGSALTIPAKINWDLRVLGRRPDGLHELRSWFLAVEGGDRLAWRPGASGLQVTGPAAAGVPADEGNLVLRAEAAWRQAGGRAPAGGWFLHKEIPAGSGLGGGSGDAAAALRLLQAAAGAPLDGEVLRAVARTLGADLLFFLEGRDAELRGGTGDTVLARAEPPAGEVLLALPPFAVPTAPVYARSGAAPWRPGAVEEEAPASLPPPAAARNDLEAAACSAVPAMQAFLDALRRYAPFRMSGSGGACFLYLDAGEAAPAGLRRDPALDGVRFRRAAIQRGPVLGEAVAW